MKRTTVIAKVMIGVSLYGLCASFNVAAQDKSAPGADEGAEAADSDGGESEAITVVGSRGKARTDTDRPVAVDVVTAADLRSTGQIDLGQQVQFTSPSFNSTKFGVNGATNFADPASLRGMSPDQVLLLINGKRRHQFSALNLNLSPGLGTVVSDLNAIPAGAIKRIEVLRDGAAAQYGSDAIAGVINLSLNDSDSEGNANITSGIHKEGDGFTVRAMLNQGLKLGNRGGFINYTLEYFNMEDTNRSDPYDGPLYPAAPANFTGPTANFPYTTANPRADRGVFPQGPFVVGNYGSNQNRTYQAFVNSELPLTDTISAYAFGGYSRKDIRAFGFFRAPATFANSNLTIFPDGYVPILPGRSIDWSINAGLRGEVAGWDLDLSYGTGHNHLDQWARNTVNASLGAASPTEFYIGRSEFNQQVVEFTSSKNFGSTLGMDSLNVAMGLQWRRDNFQVSRGDPASYAIGPLAVTGKVPATNGRPGFAPEDENDLSRSNIGAFFDVEADITESLLLTAALRYEDYSDFGGNLSGKFAGRYKITDSIALRGSYNRGFRAPSLAQIGNRVNTSTVQNGLILQTQQISSDNPRLAQLGIPDPDAEISDSFGAGITGDFARLTVTVDAFQIDIKDRIAITDGILTANYPAVAPLFPGVREIRFFTNQIDTRTRGVDVVATYRVPLAGENRLSLTLAGTHAATEVLRQRETPAQLIAGASAATRAAPLIGLTAIELIEVALPQTKILFSSSLDVGKWNLGARASYFGQVKAFSTGLNAADSNVECDRNNRCVQTFGGKTLVDLNVTYRFSERFSLTAGGNNVFDTYPDKWNARRNGFVGEAAQYSNGQIPYTRNAGQFGFNGAYYYMSANLTF
jgi:iron complex outermembrane receptor protein